MSAAHSKTPYLTKTGIAAPLLIDNIDTDQIIPSREMKTVGRAGLAEGLFAGWRYLSAQTRMLDEKFVLNQPEYAEANILLSGANFGCGSSREHAVWALHDFGFIAIIARSFGEIFYGNCLRNGVLPIVLGAHELAVLQHRDEAAVEEIAIDLPAQTVSYAGHVFEFEIGRYEKRLLVEGLDPIGLTLRDRDAIARFITADRAQRPWLYSAA